MSEAQPQDLLVNQVEGIWLTEDYSQMPLIKAQDLANASKEGYGKFSKPFSFFL